MAEFWATQDVPGKKVTLVFEGFAPLPVTVAVKKAGAFAPGPFTFENDGGSFEREIELEPGLWEMEASDPDGAYARASMDVG